MIFFKKLVKFSLFITIMAILALSIIYLSLKDQLPSVEVLKDVQWQTPMQIYSADGKLISQFGEKRRIPLTLDQMPKQLINALLATEDDRFYYHFGVDPIGMARAIFGQIIGQNKGGASTITMQVARNFFLTRDVTYIRKIREIFTAFHIEHLLSKDEILTLYMNKIELGHRAFGYGAAAQVYYGKPVNELTLAQIAVLAGLPKAPSTLNPISNPKRARERRSVVLSRMLKQGYITPAEFQQANNAPITAKKHGANIELNAPYIAEMAHQEMIKKYGKENAYTKGYKVYTTISSDLQIAAQHALKQNLLNYDKRHGYRGPLKNILVDDNSTEVTPNATMVHSITSNDDTNTLLTEQSIADDKFTTKQWLAFLTSEPEYKPLQVGIVTALTSTSATIKTHQGREVVDGIINWQNMAWARQFIDDDHQGPPPKVAQDILTLGDMVYVEKKNNGEFILSQLPQASSAIVSLSPDNGAIEALVGGFSFKQSQYNRAIQAKRQVGSNIKPFIYSAAIDKGLTLASIINDAPINQWDKRSGVVWRPKNSPPTYVGPLRMRLGLAQSKNVISVRLLRKVGLDDTINHLSLFGFNPSELPRNESLALGSASLTPIEVATGFAVFANTGFLVTPYLIDHIEDTDGNVVFQADPAVADKQCDIASTTTQDIEPTNINTMQIEPIAKPLHCAKRVISPQNAFLITQAMNSVIWGADWSISPGWQGTGFRARTLKRHDIAGKTGTTNEAKDAWFSGFSRRIVASTWIGFDDHKRNLGRTRYNANLPRNQITGKEFGAKSAQPAWILFMKTALGNYPYEPFEQPENIVSVRIDKATGKLTTKIDRSSVFEYFIKDTEPKDYVSTDHSVTIFDSNKPSTPTENKETEIF